MELPRTTQLWKLNRLFARESNLPVIFSGVVLVETAKAAYIYGPR